jgi:Icc-related predicted phosphoesterase
MSEPAKKVRLAAVGDIHVRETDQGKWIEFFRNISQQADVLLLCGDLTDTGNMAEAEVLAGELRACTIPVVGVLGNHDYERDHQREIKKALEGPNIHLLDGQAVVVNNIGFAGVKGFGGGFGKYALAMFGESMMKQFVQEVVDDTLRLDRALAHLDNEYPGLKKVVLLHYSPVQETVIGEPPEIFPFLGSSRLAEPIDARQVVAAFHGHAHIGTLEGHTSKGTPVFNVSHSILKKRGQDVLIFEVEV